MRQHQLCHAKHRAGWHLQARLRTLELGRQQAVQACPETSSAERTPCYPCQLGTQSSCHLCARLWTSRGWNLDGDTVGSLQQGPPSIDVSGLAWECTMSNTGKLGLCLLVARTGSCNALSLDEAQVPGPGRLGADRGKAFKSCCYKGARWSKIWWFVMGW